MSSSLGGAFLLQKQNGQYKGVPRRFARLPDFRTLGISVFYYCLVICAVFSSCPSKKFEIAKISIERTGATPVAIQVELARTTAERSQGLMYRKSLPDGEGMLFIFEKDEALSFWMKNTIIPLSIAFIASDGRIVEIKDMRPGDLNSVKSSRSVRYALEVPQGWFDRAGIKTGDVVKL